ncbi:MAG: S1 RNA-binding domain-containing protein, partial [Endomicrobiia bacterium]
MTEQHNESDINFEKEIEKIQKITPGELVKVKIIEVNKDGVLVNLGIKSDGIIPISEFESMGIPKEFKPGTEIPVIVKPETTDGYRVVSYKLARQKLAWDGLLKSYKNNEPVNCKIVRKVKGGYSVDIGVDAFLPLSEVNTKFLKQKENIINSEIKVFIKKIDSKNKNIVVSHKDFVESEKKKNIEKVFSTIKEGDIIEGNVTETTKFGAFVDIGGVEGLIHISDLSWLKVEKVTDVVKKGNKIKVKVLKIDKEKNKISLGLKQLQKHPWEDINTKYPVGSIVKGKVTSITNFGAFIELEPGIEGLLHLSEISWTDKTPDIKKIIKVGAEYELKVIEINKEEKKLSLSLKRTQQNPWEKLKNEFPKGTKIKCKVLQFVPFGAFVSLPEGLTGLIHLEDMSWMKKIRQPQEILKVGEEIDAVILEIKPEEEKASLSIKHLTENPFEKYPVGKVIKGKVIKILDHGAYITLEKDVNAFLRKSEISIEKGKTLKDILKIGEEIEAKVTKSDMGSK